VEFQILIAVVALVGVVVFVADTLVVVEVFVADTLLVEVEVFVADTLLVEAEVFVADPLLVVVEVFGLWSVVELAFVFLAAAALPAVLVVLPWVFLELEDDLQHRWGVDDKAVEGNPDL
jgi:hypothetical protein